MKNLLRKLRFGSPYTHIMSEEEMEAHKLKDEREVNKMKVWLRSLEIEYGIPPREEQRRLGDSHN